MISKTTKDREVTGRERNTAETGASILSIISKDMQIEGNCETDGELRIEGSISGNVTAHGIELVASGSVDGDVIAAEQANSAQVFIISGLVTGAVHAAQVEVRLGGKVHGGVVADEAVIHGQVPGGVLARNRLALEETAEVEGDVHARRLERADLESPGKEPAPVADSVEAEDEVLVSAGPTI